MTGPSLRSPGGPGGHPETEVTGSGWLVGLQAPGGLRVRRLPFRNRRSDWKPQGDDKREDESDRTPHDDMMNALRQIGQVRATWFLRGLLA